MFASPIHQPTNEQESPYTKVQEALRKDIERAFGVLQARFNVLRKESYLWRKKEVLAVSRTCVILHNMLVRMNQEVCFEDDFIEEGQTVNIVTEVYQEECRRANERDVERNGHLQKTALEIDENGQVDLDLLRARDSFMTNPVGFQRLREDLILAVEERRRR